MANTKLSDLTALAEAPNASDLLELVDVSDTTMAASGTNKKIAFSDLTSGLVPKSLFDANTILYATSDDTPAALTVGASTIVGRKATGGIVALTAAETKTILAIDHGADLTGLGDDDHTQYHTDGRALTWMGTRSTADLPEGANLYFSDERAQDAVGSILTDSASIDFTYDDGAGTITATVIQAGIDHGSIGGLTDDDHTQYAILTPTTDARNVIQPSASTVKALVLKGAASQSDNLLEVQNSSGTAFVTVGPPTLPGNSTTVNWLNVTGTMPSGAATNTYGTFLNIASAGTGSGAQVALEVDLTAGYTGAVTTAAGTFRNTVAGTGNTVDTLNVGNKGNTAGATANTTGDNVGIQGFAWLGNLSIGVAGHGGLGSAQNKASAVYVGVLGHSFNGGASGVMVGGAFILSDNTSYRTTLASSALFASNGAQALPIFLAYDNTTKVFSIEDGGHTTWAEGINQVFGTTTGTKIGTATTQKIGFWNATPVVQAAGIADADGTLADITTKFNSLIAKLETYGLLAAA